MPVRVDNGSSMAELAACVGSGFDCAPRRLADINQAPPPFFSRLSISSLSAFVNQKLLLLPFLETSVCRAPPCPPRITFEVFGASGIFQDSRSKVPRLSRKTGVPTNSTCSMRIDETAEVQIPRCWSYFSRLRPCFEQHDMRSTKYTN